MEATRNKTLVWTLVVLGALVLAGAGWHFFAPKASDTRDEAAPASSEMLSMGTFSGADAVHHVSGTVELLRDEQGYVLHFEDYDATAGPDVYFYLTKSGTVDAEAVRLPTDTATGQATLRGSFNVRVPHDVDATQFSGITVWCDRFDVRFGGATFAM